MKLNESVKEGNLLVSQGKLSKEDLQSIINIEPNTSKKICWLDK
jgi:hypothetical protein